jgi:alkylation response protein AidB-like acyl-CoA dehydrogenase
MDFTLNKEQKDIINAARDFATKEFTNVAQEFDRNETFDLNLWRKACELGFVGVYISEKYGGGGYGFLEHCMIMEEFFTADAGIAVAILATTFGSELYELFGTEEQKQFVLPKLVSGQAIMATAVTEPDAGSDPAGATTTAVKEGDHWVINGSKMFITNGDLAEFINVFAVTNPEHSSRHGRHSFILVPKGTPGLEANKLRGKLGVRASDTAELSFSDVKVPLSNLIGEEGNGFYQLMELFNRARLQVAAMGTGIARAALEESVKYTKKRKQFGVPIASFQITQVKIAEMATMVRAARNLYYEAAWSVDHGMIDHGLIAMAKWYAGDAGVKCAEMALQLHGGYGYLDEYKVERLYRDAKIVDIWEGTKEIEKLVVARAVLQQ